MDIVQEAVAGGGDLLKAGAQRRAQLAKKAEPKENLGFVGNLVKGILSVTNKIGITGSTTRVVGKSPVNGCIQCWR